MQKLKAAIIAALFCVLPPAAQAADPAFDKIVSEVRADAAARGVSEATLNRALTDIQPLTIAHHENNQPERARTITFAQYYGRQVTPETLQAAANFRQKHAALLTKTESETGVPASVILSILNIESRFGVNMGDQKIIPALLTLVRDVSGNDKRAIDRRAMFREEAINALMLIDEGYDEILTAEGSWAGAVGPAQFMPSSLRRYGVDGNGDGKKNLWSDYDDIIPSVANYLKEKGWKADQRWGRKIQLPENFDKHLMTDKLTSQINKTPNEWAALGVTLPEGKNLPDDNTLRAMLIAPNYNVSEGTLKGPYYMVYDNFRIVMEYNKSYKYALTVLQMSDALGGRTFKPAAPDPYNQ